MKRKIFRTKPLILFCLFFTLLTGPVLKAQVSSLPVIQDTTCEMWHVLSYTELPALKAFYEQNGRLKEGLMLFDSFQKFLNEFMTIAIKEYYYLPQNNMTFCELRADVTSPELLDFFISNDDSIKLTAIIQQFQKDLADKKDICPFTWQYSNYLGEFLNISKKLSFSKLEIFHESTGYWCPECYVIDSISPFNKERLVQGSWLYSTLIEMNKLYNSEPTPFGTGLCLAPGSQKSITNKSTKRDNKNLQVYPNPTAGNLIVSYRLDNPSVVSVEIFGDDGKALGKLKDNVSEKAGSYNLRWEGASKNFTASGKFLLVKLTVNGTISTEKVLIIQ